MAMYDGPRRQPEVVISPTIELARLVDLASAKTGVAVEYDPSALRGSVTLRGIGEIPISELWVVTNKLLWSAGLTTVRTADADVLTVVRAGDAAGAARIERGSSAGREWESAEAKAGFVTVRADVAGREAERVMAGVKALLSPGAGRLTAVPGTDLMLVSERSDRIGTVLGLIRELGARGRVVTQRIELSSLTPETAVPLLMQLRDGPGGPGGADGAVLAGPDGRSVLVVAPESELAWWRGALAQIECGDERTTVSYSPRYFSLEAVAELIEAELGRDDQELGSGSLRIVRDELTGALIITASAHQHERVEAIMGRLERAPPEARRPVRPYVVRNREVGELTSVLRSLISAGVLGQGASWPGSAQQAAPGGSSDVEIDLGGVRPGDAYGRAVVPGARAGDPTALTGAGSVGTDGMVLTADEATGSIIASGEPRVLDRLQTLIEQLDIRRPQVMLEVVLVSMTEGEARDLGVELAGLIKDGETRIRLSSLFGLGTLGADGLHSLGAGAGFTGTVLDPGNYSVVVRALETLSDGRTLSMPRVLVANNEQATIDSVLQQPILQTNASDTVATTSFGGTQDAGTQLTITPQITEGDHILLEYSISLSAFVGDSADPSLPPPRQQNSVNSVVTIPDGYTIVVGGLEFVSEGDAESRLPGLGAIPVLGELFKSRSKEQRRERFFVFIRAEVLRDINFEDLKYLSGRDTYAAGVDDGWPTVEPRVIR